MTNQFGIYVHIPFCVHKCSYCDFYSFTQFGEADFGPFTDKLIADIISAARWLRTNKIFENKVTSIFLGGGTPSLLPAKKLKDIFEVLKKEFDWSQQIEITIEANPETITENLLENWRQFTPINRVSMGAQSFQVDHLKNLERIGTPERIFQAATLLKNAGYINFNLDLIIGIPGQTLDQIVDDIRKAARLAPTHLSNYNLSLKPGHSLFKQLPNSDVSADLYETARLELEKLNYQQYEISNYSKRGFECLHNLLYWSGGDFLGVGPSASSRFFWDGIFHHRKQLADYSSYLKQTHFDSVPFSATTIKETQLEALFLELRKNEGINLTEFKEHYGLDLMTHPKLPLLEKEGFLELKKPTLRLTSKGRLLADSLVCELI